MRKICFITGSRADYGLIKPVLDEVRRSKFKLRLIVLGSHLDPKYGNTIEEIRKDKIKIDAQIKMRLRSDSSSEIVKSMAAELAQIADVYTKLKPDLVVITGDRYEMLAAASAALIFRIPIAHIYGGDVTEGAFDDSIRHAITKMAALHFVSNADSKKRIIQMGESAQNVFDVGSPSLDKLKTLKKISRKELESILGLKFRENNILVTFHPETLSKQSITSQMKELFGALGKLDNSNLIIFTMPNADPEGQVIRKQIMSFVKRKGNAKAFESLGYHKYFSLLAQVDVVVGNSSSGLYEVPSFKIPTINIGNRQTGRLKASSVIDAKCTKKAILSAVTQVKKLDCSKTKNPYGDGNSSKKIIAVLEKIEDFSQLIYKKFYDLHNSRNRR